MQRSVYFSEKKYFSQILFRINKNKYIFAENIFRRTMKRLIIGAVALTGIVNVDAQTKKDSLNKASDIEEIELFGESTKQPKGLDIITRLPLSPQHQVQNVSVISHRAISEMGALSVTDAAKNIPGVVLFSNYGGGAESMSIRGYRGTPTLKNGVLMNSDFRRNSVIVDMQGVESIQVIRGVAALTQGISNSLGAPGGVINIVTKTPKFIDRTNIGFRYGSWNTFRPTLDFQKVLDSEGKIAVRVNASYQKNSSFVHHVKGEKIYVSPSIAFRPDGKTEIIAQMDYLKNKRTPNRGTVNLGNNETYAIYDIKEKFFGFASDNTNEISYSYMISADRKLSEYFKIRAAYMAMDSDNESVATGRLTTLRNQPSNYALRRRTVGKSGESDRSKVFQVDFVGHNLQTGILKHTFQLGFDWKQSHRVLYTYHNNDVVIDNIDVTGTFTNFLSPENLAKVNAIARAGTDRDIRNPLNPSIGIMAQEIMEIGEFAKISAGIRYGKFNGDAQKGQKHAWNPSVGLMLSPWKNISLYASYTNSTDLRNNNNPSQGGGTIGPSTTNQFEMGVKTEWFDEKLRFNLNLYNIALHNLSYRITDENGNNTPFFGLAGDLKRKGVEIELVGKILPELEVMAGYSYLNAQYQNSKSFVDGSAPIMTPKHTANGWLNYTLRNGALRGFNFGGGVYYVGDRPSNDHAKRAGIIHDTDASKPFDFKAYTTLNAQIGYTFKNVGIKIFANNLSDSIGYSAYYRGGFINRTDPRNFAVQVNYKF